MYDLPVGKLPSDQLRALLDRAAKPHPRVRLGPGIGLDCAVIEVGRRLLVAKSDPITFTREGIGWYAVHVNANDVATTGAQPLWFLATVLLPEVGNQSALAEDIFRQIREACDQVGAVLVGGHTEITAGLQRPIVAGTMLGEVEKDRLITPRGARPGDHVLLTKGIPIEGTSIIARELADRLTSIPEAILANAREVLHAPGISVLREAQVAARVGGVHAMHDPTEAGLAGGLWELAEAAAVGIEVDPGAIPILPEGRLVCEALGIDPMATIASGALLLAADPRRAERVRRSIEAEGIACAAIGLVVPGQGVAMRTTAGPKPLPRPPRDALAALFDPRSP
jgi:hydrogenase maturation factor